ncbi:hypothetical protein DL93DRAFT_2217152 [Clavulina sp. PMI_390]|nr:hypothetical protein DL93DRAFT_2217152 [Clavulina sp. PMI_390]
MAASRQRSIVVRHPHENYNGAEIVNDRERNASGNARVEGSGTHRQSITVEYAYASPTNLRSHQRASYAPSRSATSTTPRSGSPGPDSPSSRLHQRTQSNSARNSLLHNNSSSRQSTTNSASRRPTQAAEPPPILESPQDADYDDEWVVTSPVVDTQPSYQPYSNSNNPSSAATMLKSPIAPPSSSQQQYQSYGQPHAAPPRPSRANTETLQDLYTPDVVAYSDQAPPAQAGGYYDRRASLPALPQDDDGAFVADMNEALPSIPQSAAGGGFGDQGGAGSSGIRSRSGTTSQTKPKKGGMLSFMSGTPYLFFFENKNYIVYLIYPSLTTLLFFLSFVMMIILIVWWWRWQKP